MALLQHATLIVHVPDIKKHYEVLSVEKEKLMKLIAAFQINFVKNSKKFTDHITTRQSRTNTLFRVAEK